MRFWGGMVSADCRDEMIFMDKRDKHDLPPAHQAGDLQSFQWDEKDKSRREMNKKKKRKVYFPCEN